MADFEIARAQREENVHLDCKAGCDHCCHTIVMATAPEILALHQFILDTFSTEQLQTLKARLDAYEQTMAPLREKKHFFEVVPCPLLQDSLCTAYEARPLWCRGRNSRDVNACELANVEPDAVNVFPLFASQWQIHRAVQQGMSHGLSGQLPMGRFETAQCLKLLLDQPNLQEDILAKRAAFPSPAQAPKPTRFDARPGDVAIKKPEDINIALSGYFIDLGRFDEADRVLDDGNVLHLFAKLKAPRMVSSFEQILEWQAWTEKALARLEEMDFDPKVAVNALTFRSLLGLHDQGVSRKEMLERVGHVIVDKITSKAFPHLTEPMGQRKPGKCRVGYISTIMHNNSGSRWALGWLKSHGPEFETYALNVGAFNDIVTQRFADAADHYYHLQGEFQPVAEFIRSLDLDALIFTDIGTREGDGLFPSVRLARAQCTAWGMPETSGLPTIDYYLGSELADTEDGQSEYTETLVRLPNTGLVLPRPKGVIHPKPRSDFGLPEGFLPMMLQNLYKWAPQNDEVLARVHDRLGQPIPIIAFPSDQDLAVFKGRMDRLGVQCHYLPRTDSIGWDRYAQMADVVFDPPTWSGGITTLRAFAVGTTAVTLPGRLMRSRMTASFNTVAGVGGLNAKDLDDYIDLIMDPDRQRDARKTLNADALYEDKRAATALNQFLLGLIVE